MMAQLELTKDEVLGTLKTKYPAITEFEIIEFKVEPLSARNGFLGDHAILTVSFTAADRPNCDTFFIKFFPRIPLVAEFAEGTGAFRKEVFIYNLFDKIRPVAPILSTCVTNCYLRDSEKYLIMDNLAAQYFTGLDKFQTLNYELINTVIQSLAKLHASSLIYEEKMSEKTGKPYRLIEDHAKDFEESYYNDREDFINKKETDAGIVGILRLTKIFNFPENLVSGKKFVQVLEPVCQRVYELVKPSEKFRNVICHGDLWATNFLIKFINDKPQDCKFVDFQCGRYTPPAQDLMSLLYLTTSREFRAKNMYSIVGYYYHLLEKNLTRAGLDLSKLLSLTDFLESCQEQKLFAMLQTATYFPLILMESSALIKYFSDQELYQKAFLEDRSYLVVDYMDKDENYKQRMYEALQDLKEYCDYL